MMIFNAVGDTVHFKGVVESVDEDDWNCHPGYVGGKPAGQDRDREGCSGGEGLIE